MSKRLLFLIAFIITIILAIYFSNQLLDHLQKEEEQKSMDHWIRQPGYPQRIWYDNETQTLYVISALEHSIYSYDVSRQWDMRQLSIYKNISFLYRASDFHLIDKILYVIGGINPHLTTLDYSDPENPIFLDSLQLNDVVSKNGFSTCFKNETGTLVFAVCTVSDPGYIHLVDASDPTNLRRISSFHTINPFPFTVYSSKNNSFLYVYSANIGNETTSIYDIRNPYLPCYVGFIPDFTSNIFIYRDKQNQDIIYSCSSSSFNVFNWSVYNKWVLASYFPVESNGEFYTDEETLVTRHMTEDNDTGVDFYNISTGIKIGYYGNSSISLSSHMQWLDTENKRAFILSYGDGCLYSLNITSSFFLSDTVFYKRSLPP